MVLLWHRFRILFDANLPRTHGRSMGMNIIAGTHETRGFHSKYVTVAVLFAFPKETIFNSFRGIIEEKSLVQVTA